MSSSRFIDPVVALHDEEAEQHLLGGMMLWAHELGDEIAKLKPVDCYKPAHATTLDAIQRLVARGHAVDITTVWSELGAMKRQQTVGGTAYLGELTTHVGTCEAARVHFARVLDLSRKRALRLKLSELVAQVDHNACPFGELADHALRDLMDVTSTSADKAAKSLGELCERVFAELSADPSSRPVRHRTGFGPVDALLGPLEGGQLIVVGARPSLGKTSWVLSVALHVARAGGSVLFHSLETTDVRIASRAISSASRVRLARLAGNEGMAEGEMQRALAGAQSLYRLPVWIDDDFDATIARITAKSRRHKAKNGLALVVIDYLQLIEAAAGRGYRNREQEIASVSRGLKRLAKELDVPVIALSQLNRESEKRGDKKPTNADLRESGQLEQDADAILLLWRDEAMPAELQVYVSKQKDGPTGDAALLFDRATTSFCEPTEAEFESRRLSTLTPLQSPTRSARSNSARSTARGPLHAVPDHAEPDAPLYNPETDSDF